MTTLQNVIEKLTGFWHEQGCAVLPPCTFEVPLGLLHPEAFFRLLDPEPWRAAFVQPISRPADARGGRHPYRVARHLQLQVVWKEIDARAPRDLMLQSLERMGFDLAEHDVRFIDQRLDIDAAEIRGRGWRLVLDGLRLGRISFLDSVAGEPLVRPSVELSYGVELLAMAQAEAADIFAVPWLGSGGLEVSSSGSDEARNGSFRESAPEAGRAKRREGEEELHTYVVEIANVAYLRQAIDGLDREALRCIEAGLPRIAYEQAMRMLPLLDVLETRGDLSLPERRHWLAEIRSRVLEAARAYRGNIEDKKPLRQEDATEKTTPEPAPQETPEEDSGAASRRAEEVEAPAKRKRKKRPEKKKGSPKPSDGQGA